MSNAELIAEAVNALPGLLDEVDRLRAALVDAGLSLASYEEACGQGSGMNEAADIARLLGWEGGSDENMKDWYAEAINAKG